MDPVVTARFRCLSITHVPDTRPENVMVEVRFNAVWEQDGPNKAWSKATPAGEIRMLITNPAAIEQFKLGQVYELPFIPIAG